MKNYPPIIADLDNSVLPLSEHDIRIPLAHWQEHVRFSCSHANLQVFTTALQQHLPTQYGCVFTGSGDFHHLSLPLIQRTLAGMPHQEIDLIVCDNHPDNMRYPWGVHCGSWVYHASKLPGIRHIHVVGITSTDICLAHAWENYLSPFLHNKLTYWSINRSANWLSVLQRKNTHHTFTTPTALLDAFLPVLTASPALYLSIDKDVYAQQYLQTNWDQGLCAPEHLITLIKHCHGKLYGCDVTGDVSQYTYTSKAKRLLTWLDKQPHLAHSQVLLWQQQHQQHNRELLHHLSTALMASC